MYSNGSKTLLSCHSPQFELSGESAKLLGSDYSLSPTLWEAKGFLPGLQILGLPEPSVAPNLSSASHMPKQHLKREAKRQGQPGRLPEQLFHGLQSAQGQTTTQQAPSVQDSRV